MQKLIASLMAVGLLLLAACGTGGELEPGPVTSFEDIAGTYQRQGPGAGFAIIHIFEDGTKIHFSSNRDLVEDRPLGIEETRFEGTKVFLKEIKGRCFTRGTAEAIYEIHLLENGNLQFVAIGEDMCGQRSSTWGGAEYAPVP